MTEDVVERRDANLIAASQSANHQVPSDFDEMSDSESDDDNEIPTVAEL
jgi:hypothetical protein